MIQLNNLAPKKEETQELIVPQQPVVQILPNPQLPQRQEVKKFDKICSPIKELLSRLEDHVEGRCWLEMGRFPFI